MTTFAEEKVSRDADGKFAPGSTGETSIDLDAGASPLDGTGFEFNALERPERIEKMKADLEAAITEIVSSGRLSEYLDARASNAMSRWSTGNRLLAASQLAQREGIKDWGEVFNRMASMDCGTFKQWGERGRKPNTGPGSALYIMAPCTRWIEEDDPTKPGKKRKRKIVVGFRPSATFDVSQTEGDPVPQHPSTSLSEGDVEAGTHEGLVARISANGYSYSEEEFAGTNVDTLSGHLGYTDPTSKKVVVDSRLNPTMKASVIAHELGHIEMGHVDDYEEYKEHRGEKETEADSFAYMMMRHRGLDAAQSNSFSPGYIAGWSKGDTKTITKALDRSSKKFSEVIDQLGW